MNTLLELSVQISFSFMYLVLVLGEPNTASHDYFWCRYVSPDDDLMPYTTVKLHYFSGESVNMNFYNTNVINTPYLHGNIAVGLQLIIRGNIATSQET